MEIGQREQYKNTIPELKQYFSLYREIKSLQSLPTALFMNFIEDAFFYNEAPYKKPEKVLDVFKTLKRTQDIQLNQHLDIVIESFNKIYAENNLNLLEQYFGYSEFIKFLGALYNNYSVSLGQLSEELAFFNCSKLFEINIYLYMHHDHTKIAYLYRPSRCNLYVFKTNSQYYFLYPKIECYSEATGIFQGAKVVECNQNNMNSLNMRRSNGGVKESIRQTTTMQGYGQYGKDHYVNPIQSSEQVKNFNQGYTGRNDNQNGFGQDRTKDNCGQDLLTKKDVSPSLNSSIYFRDQPKNTGQGSPESKIINTSNSKKYTSNKPQENSKPSVSSQNHAQNYNQNLQSNLLDSKRQDIGNKIKKLIKPLCFKCQSTNNSFKFFCGCSICHLCIEDQFFFIKKYLCPSCGRNISNEARLSVLEFIKQVTLNLAQTTDMNRH